MSRAGCHVSHVVTRCHVSREMWPGLQAGADWGMGGCSLPAVCDTWHGAAPHQCPHQPGPHCPTLRVPCSPLQPDTSWLFSYLSLESDINLHKHWWICINIAIHKMVANIKMLNEKLWLYENVDHEDHLYLCIYIAAGHNGFLVRHEWSRDISYIWISAVCCFILYQLFPNIHLVNTPLILHQSARIKLPFNTLSGNWHCHWEIREHMLRNIIHLWAIEPRVCPKLRSPSLCVSVVTRQHTPLHWLQENYKLLNCEPLWRGAAAARHSGTGRILDGKLASLRGGLLGQGEITSWTQCKTRHLIE